MPSLATIRSANSALRQHHNSLTAVFTGVTRGIGLATLQTFVKSIPHPTVLIAGRNALAFEPEIAHLRALNPDAEITFIEADLSLIRNVDAVAEQISTRLDQGTVDLLCMSQGYAPLEGRRYTDEGLDRALALMYYGRLRLLDRLIASRTLKKDARVLNVLAGSKEGRVFEGDFALERNYSILNLRGQTASLTSLSHDVLSERNPGLSLLHVYPGTVDTGVLARGVQGWMMWVVVLVLERLLMLFNRAMSVEESGERMVELVFGRGFGRGSWSMDEQGNLSRSEWFEGYRGNESMKWRVWEFNEGMWERALGGK